MLVQRAQHRVMMVGHARCATPLDRHLQPAFRVLEVVGVGEMDENGDAPVACTGRSRIRQVRALRISPEEKMA